MTNTTRTVRATLLTTLALLTVAAAAPTESGYHGNHLYVTLTRDTPQFSDTRDTLLLCDPPQGHTQATQACAELTTANGDIDRIPQRNSMCPEIYAPIRATAQGEWNGTPVTYERTFANGCVLAARTGAVFALSS